MKSKIFVAMFAAAALCCTKANAQGRPSLNIGAELGIPMGDLNNTQKIGVGGSLKALFPVFEGGSFTLSAGYISYSGDEYNGPAGTMIKLPALNFIPIKAGIRYQFLPGGFYMEPQLGYTSISTPNSNTSAKGGFTYAYNLGYMINRQFDLSARYEGLSRNGSHLDQLGFRLGYNFSL